MSLAEDTAIASGTRGKGNGKETGREGICRTLSWLRGERVMVLECLKLRCFKAMLCYMRFFKESLRVLKTLGSLYRNMLARETTDCPNTTFFFHNRARIGYKSTETKRGHHPNHSLVEERLVKSFFSRVRARTSRIGMRSYLRLYYFSVFLCEI